MAGIIAGKSAVCISPFMPFAMSVTHHEKKDTLGIQTTICGDIGDVIQLYVGCGLSGQSLAKVALKRSRV
jgi:hypothetical protein